MRLQSLPQKPGVVGLGVALVWRRTQCVYVVTFQASRAPVAWAADPRLSALPCSVHDMLPVCRSAAPETWTQLEGC